MTKSSYIGTGRRVPGFSRRLIYLLAGSTLSMLPLSASADVVPPKIYTLTPGGINVAEGGFTYKQVDLSVGGIDLERFYDGVPPNPDSPGNDRDPEGMFFGTHTGHNLDIYVTSTFVPANAQGGSVTYPQHWHTIVHIGSGASGTYWQQNFNTDAQLAADDGDAEKGTLSYVRGVYTYTDQSGVVYTFTPSVRVGGTPGGVQSEYSQRIASIAYPDGRVRSFSYNSNGWLKLVSDTSGYAVVFDYNGSGLISAACGFDTSRSYVTSSSTCSGAALRTSYAYAGSHLTDATDVLGNTTHYDYGGDLISCVKPAGYASCKIANSYSGRNVTQTMADGAVWHVNVNGTFQRSDGYVPEDGDDQTNVTDPNGKGSTYTFTGSTPYQATDANGNTTSYVFVGGSNVLEAQNTTVHTGSLLQEVDLPEGNKYLANNNGPYHALLSQTMRAKPGSGLGDETVTYGYSCTNGTLNGACAKPTSRTDAVGNTTNWLYASSGLPLWEMQPAPTSGAARPLKLYAYALKNAYVLNGNGNLVASGSQIWTPVNEVDCQTVAGSSDATCDANAPQMRTDYEYGADGTADNLLVRGKVVSSGGVSLRTCYRYDAQGNRIAETTPRAGLGSCPA